MTTATGGGNGRAGDAWTHRPGPDEYHDFYAGYVGLVPERHVLGVLEEGVATTRALLDRLPPGAEAARYAPEKWSVRQVVGHMTDTERVFAYRALHMARRDPAPLPGMDQEEWGRASDAADRPLAALLDDMEAVRGATLRLFRGLSAGALDRRGTASRVEFTVRALAWIAAGHEIHHRRILEERYLPAVRREGKGE